MHDFAYTVSGFLTVRRDSMRVPLSGSLALRADLDSGLFTGDLVLDRSTASRTVAGVTLFTAAVQIAAESPVLGVVKDGQVYATVTVDAVITEVRSAGRTLISSDSCRTASHAAVPLHSETGFGLERGGRLAGTYHRPPFTGCGWATPLINLLVAGPGNTVVIDLVPLSGQAGVNP
jgi:hypothetical protein